MNTVISYRGTLNLLSRFKVKPNVSTLVSTLVLPMSLITSKPKHVSLVRTLRPYRARGTLSSNPVNESKSQNIWASDLRLFLLIRTRSIESPIEVRWYIVYCVSVENIA